VALRPEDRFVTEEQIERITVDAEREAGAPAGLLGSYVTASLENAIRGRRLPAEAVEEFRSQGEAAAEQGVELPRLLDLYLSATWRLSDAVTTGERPPRDVGSWATALFRASDDAAAAVCDGYQSAQRRAMRREEAIRREFVDDLLGGRSEGESLLELARQVGFNLAGDHRCVVATTGRALRDAGPVQARVEAALAETHEGTGIVATKDGALVCVVPSARTDAGSVVLDYVRRAESGTWRVGVGGCHAGATGVARSFREAREALSIGERLDLPGPVADFVDLAPLRLLTRDIVLLRETVATVLGPLEAARGGASPLLETLDAYFDEALSTTAAARRLHLSVRAVSYRLERIATLTGRSLRDPHDRFILETAVRGRKLLDLGPLVEPDNPAP
jgi:DNA-binding PucR family transcriptional regulator